MTHAAAWHGGARAQRGLSLIEVVVALVVISGFGAALFVWAGQTLQTASRAVQVQQEVEIERNVTELAASLNPAERPGGEWLTPTHRYRWQTVAERSSSDQARHPMGLGPYRITLYDVRFSVDDLESRGEPLVTHRDVAGYRQVREKSKGPPGFAPVTPG
ncbi:MAG: type II secretion system protein [Rubrivivax sp.]